MKNDNLIQVTGDRFSPDISSRDNVNAAPALLSHRIRSDRGIRGVRSVNITSDNRFLIISYESSIPRIRVVDLENLEFLPFEYAGHNATVRLTCLTSDNKAFYTASWDGSSRRYELLSGKCTNVYSGFGRSPSCFLYEPKYLFTASYDHDIDLGLKNSCRCWDLATGKLLKVFKHTNNRLFPEAMDIVFDGDKLFTGSDDGCLYEWKLDKDEPVMTYFSSAGTVRKLALSENLIAAACNDTFVYVHFRDSGACYRNFGHNERDVREVRISKDETRLWSATDNGTIYCFCLLTGELIYRRRIHPLWIWSLALGNNEKIIISGSGDGSVAFLNSATGSLLARLYNLAGSPDLVITCPPDNTFPAGFFYSANKDLISVLQEDRGKDILKELEMNDPEREAYISQHNLRHLVIARLKDEEQYNSLTNSYMQRIRLLEMAGTNKPPLSLKS